MTTTPPDQCVSVQEAARRTGVSPGTLRRWVRDGLIPQYDGRWTQSAVGHARVVARLRERGHSLDDIRRAQADGRLAFERIITALGWSPAQTESISPAHEPLMRSGSDGLEMAEEIQSLTRQLLPVSSPVMDHVHQHHLQHFVEQDVVGHMEADLDGGAGDLGRMRVVIAFAETIGDEVMIVGLDAAALTDWAVDFQRTHNDRPLPRIAVHSGQALYRDGDYYGRDVNLASRVAAYMASHPPGEVLVTRPVAEAAGAHLASERIGEVRLEGFSDATEIFIARRRDGE
jgi:class 3 adenylate cyclase